MTRIETPFTNEHFAAWCLRMVGQPYWYGTCGSKASRGLLQSKSRQYPKYYTAAREKQYLRDIAERRVVCDCIGGCKAYAWTGGGESILTAIGTDAKVVSAYGSHGCPDRGANSMFAYAKNQRCAWGDIASLPDVPGLALYQPGHVGYTVGEGCAAEWRGFAYGCVRTAIAGRGWTHWFALPFIDYGDALPPPLPPTVRKGSSGEDVRKLQNALLALGYDLGACGADGVFGACTRAAVIAFQKSALLDSDGICGPLTWSALLARLPQNE